MKPLLAEFIGTCMLVFLGEGVSCNLSLTGSGMKTENTAHILIGWGFAVMVPAFIFGGLSGAHFNPAVSIGAAIRGDLAWGMVPAYCIAQLLGGFCGAALLMVLFGDHIRMTKDDNTIRGCFCTAPSVRNIRLAFLSELLGTFVLVFALSSVPTEAAGSGVNWMMVYGVIVVLVGSLGGHSGAALNAARDTMPRLAYQLICPDQGKKNPDWQYGWVPVVAPIIGAVLGSLLHMAMFG